MTFDLALTALAAVLVWWFTTGVILWLDGLPKRTHACSMYGMTALAMAAVPLVVRSANDNSWAGAFLGFGAAVVLWGWLELSFLLGYVTGPRRIAAVPGSSPWKHFRQATQAVIHHELAILAVGGLIFGLTRHAELPTAWWAYCVLWGMRLSAKLNLFLGVPNVNDELLPPHLAYLGSYFRKRPMNLLFPVSVSASTVAATFLAWRLTTVDAGSPLACALTLVLALLVLAILEHWFMVLPLPVNGLWRWALRSKRRGGVVAGASAEPDAASGSGLIGIVGGVGAPSGG